MDRSGASTPPQVASEANEDEPVTRAAAMKEALAAARAEVERTDATVDARVTDGIDRQIAHHPAYPLNPATALQNSIHVRRRQTRQALAL